MASANLKATVRKSGAMAKSSDNTRVKLNCTLESCIFKSRANQNALLDADNVNDIPGRVAFELKTDRWRGIVRWHAGTRGSVAPHCNIQRVAKAHTPCSCRSTHVDCLDDTAERDDNIVTCIIVSQSGTITWVCNHLRF